VTEAGSFLELKDELLDAFRRGVGEPMPDAEFNDLALRVFRFQCEHNRAYRGFVARRGVEPERAENWEGIPFLPTRAFKAAALVSGKVEVAERVFRTSGTTGGRELRGSHHVRDLHLYRENLLPNFAAHLLENARETLPILCLLPSAETAPDSSLSFMMAEAIRSFGTDSSGFFVGSEGSIESRSFLEALEGVAGVGAPVLVAGTAFSFVAWTKEALEKGWRFTLPAGSRIMETGGYKGRSTVLSRDDLYGALTEALGVPEGRIVNEYGMTELLSQFYEPGLSAGFGGLSDRFLSPPPWVRTSVLDPMTLEPRTQGEVGVLAHFDLANLGSVAAILTEDLGLRVPGGFRLVGRAPGSEPRGCSLAMEDFLASRRDGLRSGDGPPGGDGPRGGGGT
jgi:hypothetical protein